MDDSSKIQATLDRVEDSLKELQVVAIDMAVVKTKVDSLLTDVDNIYKAIFNGTHTGGGLIDRTTRIEDSVRNIQNMKIEDKIPALERNKVEVVDCKKLHGEMSAKLWKIMIPLIVAFVVAIAGILFNDLFITRSSGGSEKDIENRIKQVIQEELRGNYHHDRASTNTTNTPQ